MKCETLRHLLTGMGILVILCACSGGGSSSESNVSTGSGDIMSTPVISLSYISESPMDDAGSSTDTIGATPATVSFLLTDAPDPSIDSAVVTLSNVNVHGTGGGQFTVMDEARTLDLLDLQNGVTSLLGEIYLEPNKYTQIRMSVETGEVTSGDTTYAVVIPSNEIKINHNIDICSDGEIEVLIDFDAKKSLSYNKGRDIFTMKPVVHVQSVTSTCPDALDTLPGDTVTDTETDVPYAGPLGWFSIVVPPINAEDFSSLIALLTNVQVHDQGIGQVKTFAEDYIVDLLEVERLVTDEETGEELYTVLLPPIQIPAGDLDQVRLLFDAIDAMDAESGLEVSIQLPPGDDTVDPPEEPGLKFFDLVQVCENSLTTLFWDLDLSAASLPYSLEDSPSVVTLHPTIQSFELISTCEAYEVAGEEAGTEVAVQ